MDIGVLVCSPAYIPRRTSDFLAYTFVYDICETICQRIVFQKPSGMMCEVFFTHRARFLVCQLYYSGFHSSEKTYPQ